MNEIAAPGGSLRELAYRECDGLHITLSGTSATTDSQCRSSTPRTGSHSRSKPPRQGSRRFHHPYSYAASHFALPANLLRAA
jgi:hypothetical protein